VTWSGKLGTIIQDHHPDRQIRHRRTCALVQLDPFYIPAQTGHQHLTPAEGIYLQTDLVVVGVADE
jgi:hypothetical protein